MISGDKQLDATRKHMFLLYDADTLLLRSRTLCLSKTKSLVAIVPGIIVILFLILSTLWRNSQPNSPLATTIPLVKPPQTTQTPTVEPTSPALPQGIFLSSIDTMKESRDTESKPLTKQEIQSIVKISASIDSNYITVDTNWDYPDYMKEWIDAIRATGKHVWFRTAPNQWENDNHVEGIMTPEQYENAEKTFILTHPDFFQPSDIFDACSEPEQGHYWQEAYGTQWTTNVPNDATRAYNLFIRATTDTADIAFKQINISNVITTVRSINSFFATHPNVLEARTVQRLGHITVDSYPENNTTDGEEAAQLRTGELKTIENLWHVPLIIGEMGYSNQVGVDDNTQRQVVHAELVAINALSYVVGLNYWVGPGSDHAGGYTYLFTQTASGYWVPRAAASDLASFYASKVNR